MVISARLHSRHRGDSRARNFVGRVTYALGACAKREKR